MCGLSTCQVIFDTVSFMDVPKIRIRMFRLPKVENDHDDEISELLDKAGLVVIALLFLVSKHLLNIEGVVR